MCLVENKILVCLSSNEMLLFRCGYFIHCLYIKQTNKKMFLLHVILLIISNYYMKKERPENKHSLNNIFNATCPRLFHILLSIIILQKRKILSNITHYCTCDKTKRTQIFAFFETCLRKQKWNETNLFCPLPTYYFLLKSILDAILKKIWRFICLLSRDFITLFLYTLRNCYYLNFEEEKNTVDKKEHV